MRITSENNFTPEQNLAIDRYVSKWVAIACRTQTMNQAKTVQAINFLYEEVMNQNTPTSITFFDSPKDCQLALQNLGKTAGSITNRFKLIHRKLQKELEHDIWFGSAVQIYSKFYSQFHKVFNGSLRNEADIQLQEYLTNREIHYFAPTWSNCVWTELCRYGFYDYLLQEVFPEKKPRFELFEQWVELLPELHQCWLFGDTAVVCNFPKEIQSRPQDPTPNNYMYVPSETRPLL